MHRFMIFCHPLIEVCPFFFSYQHCRVNDKSQAPHISFVTHWVHVPATGAPLRAHLRLEQHPLASCINSMTHHASLWQAPPLLGCPRSVFNLRASKWSELTHYFPTEKKRELAGSGGRGTAKPDPIHSYLTLFEWSSSHGCPAAKAHLYLGYSSLSWQWDHLFSLDEFGFTLFWTFIGSIIRRDVSADPKRLFYYRWNNDLRIIIESYF